MRFGDLRLLTDDYIAMFRFYRDTLELPVDWGDESSGYAQFKPGPFTLALYSRAEMARIVGTEAKPNHAEAQDRYALSFPVDDVDATHTRLLGRGAQSVTAPHDQTDWGYRIVHFRDPDGNLLEFYSGGRE